MAHRDPELGTRRQVDVVEAHGELGDHAQIPSANKKRAIDTVWNRTEQAFDLSDERRQLFGVHRLRSWL
jgi:hypothetical protein